jgi:hypothetical protein
MNGTSGTELATGTYTQFIGGIAALVVEEEDKESFNELGALFEPTVIVTKSGADFEINATGYIYQYQYQPNQKKLDVKATWRGKIEVEKY